MNAKVKSARQPSNPIIKLIIAILLLNSTAVTPSHGIEDAAMQKSHILGRGVNLGNALDAPTEGAWGVTLKAEYFQAIKMAGFRSVRIPIRWSAHAMPLAPYTIAPQFFARVDWAVQQALSQRLSVVIDVHHYEELYKDPTKEFPRLVALWTQIAAHYQASPDDLFFELLNEPTDQITDERWQEMVPALLAVVRKTNPDRIVIVGPGHLNGFSHLEDLHLPDEDRRLLATFHYYLPLPFTHQQAPWVPGSDQWKDRTWAGTGEEQEVLRRDFAVAATWATKNRRPLYLGEFGAYEVADMDSRARWTRAVAREAERQGFSWAYWEFCANFGAYDSRTGSWREPLLRALLPGS
jgi:endoglucanase